MNFIEEQWNSSGFNLDTTVNFYIEFKRVFLSLK
jgi:hypothetical protein